MEGMYQQAIQNRPAARPDTGTRLRRVLFRKIWLPRSVYATLPCLYIFLGAYAIAAALFLSHWSWIVPYLLLVGMGCLHAGVTVLSARMRWLHRRPPNLPE